MPAEGFKSITINTKVYEQLEKFAKKTKRSIPKAIEFLLEQHKEEEVKHAQRSEVCPS